MINELNSINESVRAELNNLISIREETKALYTDNQYEYLLKEKVSEHFLIAIADLICLSGLLYEASHCESKKHIKMLLEVTKFEQQFIKSFK